MYFQTLRVHINYFVGHVCVEFLKFSLKNNLSTNAKRGKKKLRMVVKKSKSLYTCVTVAIYEQCSALILSIIH